jgi:hypothetical protein
VVLQLWTGPVHCILVCVQLHVADCHSLQGLHVDVVYSVQLLLHAAKGLNVHFGIGYC